MKSQLQRIAALERKHHPQVLRGMLEGSDRADAVSRAPGPGIYMRPVEPGDSMELLVLDRVRGRLEVIEAFTP